MTAASRQLKVGDRVTTGWDRRNDGVTEYVITAIRPDCYSQSNTVVRVDPPLRLLHSTAWIDADWFKPVDEERTE